MFKAYAIPFLHLLKNIIRMHGWKIWFKKMNNVFSHNTKMKPTNCTTTIYKALLHLYSCYFAIMIKILCICIFPWKKRKVILMIVIKNVPLHKIFEFIYFIRYIKENIWSHLFIYILRFTISNDSMVVYHRILIGY